MESAFPSITAPRPRRRGPKWLVNGVAFVFGMIGGLCLLLVSVVFVVFVLDYEQSGVIGGPVPFSIDDWKQNKHVSFMRPIRMRMANDFLLTRESVGKSIDEIVAMLGHPDSLDAGPDRMSYYLEERAGLMRSKVTQLTFEFDGGSVSKATLETIYRDE